MGNGYVTLMLKCYGTEGVIEEKAIQINTLKLELLEKTESCDQTENSACTIKESLLKNEIKDLQMYISHVESDITNIKEELKSTTHKVCNNLCDNLSVHIYFVHL